MKGAKLNLGIQAKLGQKLLITPQMRQSLNILQMTVSELSTELTNILQENPVLEIVESKDDADFSNKEIDSYIENLKKIEWEDFFSEKDDFRYLSSDDDDEVDFEKFVSKQVSLEEHLLFQLKILGLPDDEEDIGMYIIGNIDENGYLIATVDEIANEIKVDKDKVEKVLKYIQDFEPSGVGARNLLECIVKQLEDMNVVPEDVELIKNIISDHYQLLEKKDIDGLSNVMGISKEYVEDLIEMIKRTDPKPGLKYYNQTKYIVPDVYVIRKGDDIEVIPNDDSIPTLKINGYYIKMLKDKNLDKNTYEYIAEKVKSALWVLKSLNQRKTTIVSVMESIVKFQREFFYKGFEALRPLRLKDIAEDVGIHESTISRVTSGKYAMTEMGVIEIKTFFVKGIQTDSGNVTTDSVKSMIKALIDDEDKSKPLSDQKISEVLSKKGVNIARRTVAKYREELGIPAAAERKNR